jgi:hypothetical protein
MNTHALRALILFACLVSVPAEAQTITRGPYLQLGSPTETSVRWRTSTATDSVVRYGSTLGNLNLSASNSTVTTEHEIRLTGLTADTKYYYSVGNAVATLAGGGSDFFILTAPTTAKPTRIWVLGDPGTGSSVQTSVRNAYYAFTGARHTDLWLMLGDNAYNTGTDAEYTSRVFNIYPTMFRKSVLWPTLGNHDAGSSDSPTQTGPYYASFTLPKQGEAGGVASGTEAYYSFNYGNIHFVCLDSHDTSRAVNGAMATWLNSDLASNTRDWLIVFFHHPPYSKGSHDSDSPGILTEMRQNFLPILESYGVDLVLAGHSHSYERSRFIDGHYGLSTTFNSSTMVKQSGSGQGAGAYIKASVGPIAHSGAVYAVPGAAGQTSGGALNHPAMWISLNVAGSMILDVDGSRLDATYLDSTGAVRDSFSMVKGGVVNTPPTVAITSPASGSTLLAPATLTVEASATDSDGSIAHVAFYHGADIVVTDPSSPYSFTWTGVPAGSYSFTAVATDNGGAMKTSAVVSVTVNDPANASPTVSLTSPANNAAFTAPATVSLAATAADSDGTISRVDFYQGASLVFSDATSPYLYDWPGVTAGTYSLTARATDNGGITSISTPVSITVNPPAGSTIVTLQQGASGYSGMTDTTIRSDATKTNYGNSTTLLADGSPDYAILMRWDLSSIPTSRTAASATVTLNVVDATSHIYELYALKRSWTESNASWTNAASGNGNKWQVAGASGANDRETTLMGTLSAAGTGSLTITLTPYGLSKLNSWIKTPSSNFGFIIQDYTTTDGIDLTSSEGTAVSQRPALTITYQ